MKTGYFLAKMILKESIIHHPSNISPRILNSHPNSETYRRQFTGQSGKMNVKLDIFIKYNTNKKLSLKFTQLVLSTDTFIKLHLKDANFIFVRFKYNRLILLRSCNMVLWILSWPCHIIFIS